MCNVQTKNAINFHTMELFSLMSSNLLAQIREIILYVYISLFIHYLALGIFNFYMEFSEKSQNLFVR